MTAGAGPRGGVGYVLKKYPRLSETFVLNEILGLEARGLPVSIFAHRPPDAEPVHPEVARVRAPVAVLPAFGSLAALGAFETLCAGVAPDGLARALDFAALLPENRRAELLVQGLHLARAARAQGLAHLHAHFMTVAAHLAHVAHLFCGIPYSVTAHAKDVYRATVDREVFRAIARSARAVVTVCDANRQFIVERFLEDMPGKVRRIYNGLPLGDVAAAAPQPREAALVLGVGRLVEKKGFRVLLEACALLRPRVPELRCVIVGDGDQRDALREAAARLGLEGCVSFTGAIPRAATLEWMRRARVLAAPCLTGSDGNQDALPTVLIEALALGLPSVSTPVAGIPEIVQDGIEGLIVPQNDARALAAALERILEDAALWRRFSEAGPPRAAARFDRERTIPHLLEVFGAARQPAPAGIAG